MTALFIIAAIVWAVTLAYAAPSVWKTMTGKPVHRGDPMRLGVFTTAVIFVAGSVRWLVAPEDTNALAAIFVLLIVDGVYIMHLMRAYGRGGPV